MIHVGHYHLEHVIGVLAGNQVAFLNFGVFTHLPLERGKAFGGVPVHADEYDRRKGQSQLFVIKDCYLPNYDAGVLQCADPSQARGG